MKTSSEIVEQLNSLMTQDMIELISTIGESLQQREDCAEGKITIGCLLINLAVTEFESSGCGVDLSITKPEWKKVIEYSTRVKI